MGKTIQTIALICTNRLAPSAAGSAAAAAANGPLGLPVGTQLKATLVVRALRPCAVRPPVVSPPCPLATHYRTAGTLRRNLWPHRSSAIAAALHHPQVCPVVAVIQWCDEISKHVEAGKLNVVVRPQLARFVATNRASLALIFRSLVRARGLA